MSTTTDPDEPGLHRLKENGQQEVYLVLSVEDRAAGFVRPLRFSYRHISCNAATTVAQSIAETYARNPKFYGGTFCAQCGSHFPLQIDGQPQFLWTSDGQPVGD